MKFLEAHRQNKNTGASPENKMLPGSRADQGGTPSTTAPKQENKTVTPSTTRPEVIALADELNVDITTVTGTGKGNTITMTDVRKAAAQRDAHTGDDNGITDL